MAGSNDNKEIIQEFVLDCRDLLDNLEVSVIALGQQMENGEIDTEMINTIFRSFHSIKGSAGFLMLNNIKEVAHAAETLLDNIRSGKIKLLEEHIELFVQSSDFMKEAIGCIESDGDDESLSEKAGEMKQVLSAAISGTKKGGKREKKKKDTAPKIEDKTEEAAIRVLSPIEEFLASEELREQFTVESIENILVIEEELLKWHSNFDNLEAIQTIFRLVHTFKGNCGFIGFRDLENLAGRMEGALDAIRDNENINREQAVKVFLGLTDVFLNTVQGLSSGGNGSIENIDSFLDFVNDLLPKGSSFKKTNLPRVGEILINKGTVTKENIETALELQQRPLGRILVDIGAANEEDVAAALKEQKMSKPETKAAPRPSQAIAQTEQRQDLRVDIGKLDALINLIGELVISHNMILHSPEITKFAGQLENFTKANQQMSKIVRELQETAMTIRMIPVSGMFKRMIRLVHDVSIKSGKKVDLRLVGEETEIDKTVVEIITDPLVHIIRNSIDHGLETAEERTKTGKPEKGTVTLTAKHEEGEVWIIIEDDGKGINRDKVLKKAIEKGMIEGDGSQLKDRDIYGLIFQPGFSTADQITDISGRGVGMDVVKKNMEKIKGRVDIDSKAGLGTKVTLRIPLTLAIIEGMMVRVGDVNYTIPILCIKEFCKPKESMITVSPGGIETLKLRNETIQILRLHELHRLTPRYKNLSDGIVIVIESDKQTAALFVDEIIGQQQTVIKGLSEYFGRVQGVSGCTILGDGTISLILDVDSLFQMALAEQ